MGKKKRKKRRSCLGAHVITSTFSFPLHVTLYSLSLYSTLLQYFRSFPLPYFLSLLASWLAVGYTRWTMSNMVSSNMSHSDGKIPYLSTGLWLLRELQLPSRGRNLWRVATHMRHMGNPPSPRIGSSQRVFPRVSPGSDAKGLELTHTNGLQFRSQSQDLDR